MTVESPAPENAAGLRRPLGRTAASTIIVILAVVVLAADQLAKFFAIQNLTPGDPVHVLGDVLVFILVFNPGAAFSMGEEVTWIFTLAMAAVAVAIVWVMITRVRSRLWAVVLGLLLGGVLGNLTDRLFRDPGFAIGHVVDYISTPWMMPAIYNIADIFIVGDMIAIALLVLLGFQFDGTRDRGSKTASEESTDSAESAGSPGSAESAGTIDPTDAVDPTEPTAPVEPPRS